MKLSFSTRGWGFSWDEALDLAEEMDFSGVELYNLHTVPALTERGGAFHKYNVAAPVRALRDRKLSVPCLDTSCDVSAAADCVPTLQSLLALAAEARVPCVSAIAHEDDDARVRERLDALLPMAEQCGVTLLLKTSGIYADTARLRALLDGYASDHLGALWHMHHPYRDRGESPDTTIKNLGAYVKHVHLRDSDDAAHYNLVGEGTLPIGELMRALGSIDYDGFISLEWKPEWMEDLPDAEVIFPHFVNHMSRFENTRGKKKSLYFNHDGTGQYVWKKDELVNLTFSQVLDRMVEEFPDQY